MEIKRGQIVILRSVFFANDEAVILKNSFPVLQAVANVLQTQPQITKLAIEGHTDDRGDITHNTDLSKRRAESVMQWLTEHGIAASRLTAQGHGPNRPIADNKTLYGRAKNRRVEFHIVEPAAMAEAAAEAKAQAAANPKVAADVEPEPSPSELAPEKPTKKGKKGKAKDAGGEKPAKKKRDKKKKGE